MLSSSRTRRIVTAALVAAAVGPLGAASAGASTVTVSDDTVAQFSAGTPSDTVVRADGAVELARTLEETFDAAALPAGWTSTPWTAGGATTVASGAMLVDGARADSGVTAGLGSTLEFRATLGTENFTHVGFATDFDLQPWAMFSTKDGPADTVYARTSDATGPEANADTPIPGVLASEPHTYRIEWTQTGFDYFVDGALLATHPIPLTAAMRAQASEFNPAGGGVSVDSMILNTHKPSGTFTSRALDAGDARVTGSSLTATSATPNGTAITYETRTAGTTAALASAPWSPLGAGGSVASPPARYLQYRATITTSDAAATSRLDKVDVAFTVDDAAPSVSITGVALSGATARVTFSSDDAGAAIKCTLDGAAPATCTSPAEFSNLSDGSHTITVQATDAGGNVGSDAKTFVVDTSAPVVTTGDVAVNGNTATIAFRSDDASAATSCKLDDAAFAGCTAPVVFRGLAPGSHTLVVQATDTHGNVGSATLRFNVAAPAAGTPAPPSGGATADVTAPKVRVSRTVRVSRRGIASARVSCPQAEVQCRVTVKLKRGGKVIARKTLTVAGFTTRTFALRLSKATRSKLSGSRRLKVTALVTASDKAGNSSTKQSRMTLLAPPR